MKRIKRAPNPARRSGYSGSDVGPALKSIGQSPIGKPTKITLQVIWNESEANRHKVVEVIRAKGLNFGSAADDHAFTFDSESDATEFEKLVAKRTDQKAAIHR